MSVKPDDIPQEVWGDAVKVVYAGRGRISTKDGPTFERVARAIMAAEKRGEEREREACAKVAAAFVDDKLYIPGMPACSFHSHDIATAIRKRQSELG